MKKGARCSAAKAFLKPIIHRPNLHISTETRVTKILIDSVTKQAYGVEFLKNRKKFTVLASKEVILSGGAINSPQLLMLSGIGPKQHLQQIGVPVIQDLKVGYNFQDHIAMSTLVFLVNQSVTVSDLTVANPQDLYRYFIEGKGPYTVPGGAEALAFIKTKYASPANDDYPDMELVLGAGALNGDVYGSFRNLLGIPDDLNEKVYLPLSGKPSFSIATVLLQPRSRGRITLKDSNPLHWPIIDPQYFSNDVDLFTMVEGIKTASSLGTSESFQKYASTMNTIPFPGCEQYQFGSNQYWACAVRRVATTLGHHVGTCKMGPSSDKEAVVDPTLSVYGVKGLRVVDGSIMPNIVAGHTNAVILMIGEKASDMIKEKWKNM